MDETENLPDRKVTIPLGVGIFLMPYIFSWFTLRKGYSKTAKAVSLAWLSFVPALLVISAAWEAVDPEGFRKASEEAEQSRLAEKAERQSAELAEEAEQKNAQAAADFENSDWKRIEEIDEMTDEKSVRYELGSREMYVSCSGGKEVSFKLRLDDMLDGTRFSKLNELVGSYGSSAPANVMIRFDGATPFTEEWSLNFKSEYIEPSDASGFFEKMRGKRKMALKIDGISFTRTYNISGSEIVYKDIKSNCR